MKLENKQLIRTFVVFKINKLIVKNKQRNKNREH